MRRLVLWILIVVSAPVLAVTPPLPEGFPGSEVTRAWLEQDPRVVEATHQLSAAESEAGMLSASPNEWTLSYSTQRRDYGSGPKSTEPSLQLERTIRFPGKGVLDRRLGTATVAVAEARRRDAYRWAARDLADLLVDWQTSVRLRELLTEQLAFAEKNLVAVERRRRAGDAAVMDVNTAEADTAETRRRLSQAASDEELARLNLRTRFPQAVNVLPTLGEPAAPEGTLEAWKARVLSASDPVRIADMEVERAELATRRARADWLPDPTLGVFKATESFSSERILGASISIPIPGRFRGHRVSQALSQAEAARAARDAQVQAVSIEATRNFIEASSGNQRWRLAEEGAAKTQANADLTQRAYSLGEVDLQTLLLSRRQLSLAAEAALQARVSALRAYCRLAIDAHLMWSP